MDSWNEDKQKFIEKLDKFDRVFSEIFSKDPQQLVITSEDRIHLEKLQRENSKILKKLRSKEFTVAVVGLEKAGKSTLGNALIKSLVLPEYSERCTYTTTEIRAGDADEAEVFFYSRADFNNNFQRMFKDLGYTNEVDFASMNINTFERYWNTVEAENRLLFELHNGTTAEDIREMLKGKNTILSLLGQGSKKFVGVDQLKSETFKIFITGISGKNPDGSVMRTAHPYAVKNVIIHSTQLNDMSHIVLYDVPGFDSPTELHKKQTEEMLKEADAIILVTNVGDRPDLVGTQLDMLRKGRDEDGVKLSEKAFVFGNKIDSAGVIDTARSNLAALRNGAVNKYQIASSEHVIGGSARAYLEDIGLISTVIAKPKMDDWNMEYGINELHQKMQDYYDTDRYAVLKKRADSIMIRTEKFLHELVEKYPPDSFNFVDVGYDLLLRLKDNLDSFVEESNVISAKYLRNITITKPFTNTLIDSVEEIFPLASEKYSDDITRIENQTLIQADPTYPATKVDAGIREKLQVEFLKQLVTKVTELTQDKQKELRLQLIEKFLEIMEMKPDSEYKEELEQSVDKLFDDLMIDGGEKCHFNSLVERFSSNLLEALILSPFAEDQRFDKVKYNISEFISLSVYYSSIQPTTAESADDEDDLNKLSFADNPEERFQFFARILAHEGVGITEDYSENETFIRNIFKENESELQEGDSIRIEQLPIKKWAELLSKAGLNLEEIQADKNIKSQDKLTRKLEDLFFSQGWTKWNKQQRTESLDKLFIDYCKSNKKIDSADFGKQLLELYNKAKKIRKLKTRDDMVKAVIKAIGLEKAFVTILTKNVNMIRDGLRNNNKDNLNDWIKKNIRKIKIDEYKDNDRIMMERKTRENIVNAIRQVLNEIET